MLLPPTPNFIWTFFTHPFLSLNVLIPFSVSWFGSFISSSIQDVAIFIFFKEIVPQSPRHHEEILPNIGCIKFELTAPSMQKGEWKIPTMAGNKLAPRVKRQTEVEMLAISILRGVKMGGLTQHWDVWPLQGPAGICASLQPGWGWIPKITG